MIGIEFHINAPTEHDLDYRPIGDAMVELGQLLAGDGSEPGLFQLVSNGAVLPGMTGPVHIKDAKATYETQGEFSLTVQGPPELDKYEQATPAWDMKPGLLNGPRHHVNKSTGERYNIIPFFHKEDKLPEDIRAMANDLEFSAIVGKWWDKNWLGPVERNKYRWGEGNGGMWRLPKMPPSLSSISVSKTGYVRKTSKYSGMVKMEGAGLMTFRTVSEHSPPESWWHPGREANPVTKALEDYITPIAEASIVAAWEKVIGTWS